MASGAGTVRIGDLTVPRMGFGAMRLPGPGVWGPPADRDEAIRVVRRAVELGVRVIDTAWYYGLDVANEIIAEAIRPYPDDLVLVTKLGGARATDGSWYPSVTAAGLRAGNERDRRVLGLDTVPVTHLRWMSSHETTFDEALDAILVLKSEGKIARLGLSNVTLPQLETALARTEIVTVSNHFGQSNQADAPILERCAAEGIAYLPYFPLGAGAGISDDRLAKVAEKHGCSPSQASIAWLLARSPMILPIPGTSKVAHLDENVAAASIELDADDMALLS
ncbi:MAG TPA: aldo/keto reductase [Micromonosporaceae bacterium]|jgi:aryl-alcohol dehydrogenase-like predicted oxidoreductase